MSTVTITYTDGFVSTLDNAEYLGIAENKHIVKSVHPTNTTTVEAPVADVQSVTVA